MGRDFSLPFSLRWEIVEIFIFLSVLLVFYLFIISLIGEGDYEGVKCMVLFAALYVIAMAMIGD